MTSFQHPRWVRLVFKKTQVLFLIAALGTAPLLAQQASQQQTSEQPGEVNIAEQNAQRQIVQLAAQTAQIAQLSPAQEQPSSSEIHPPEGSSPAGAQEPPGGKRVFGVLPNYRTADAMAVYMPLTWKQKLTIASKDSFDYPLVLVAAAFAGLSQVDNDHPQFGQGMAGFGRRIGTAYADQAIGNKLTEGFVPILLHEDPRYFRRGTGSKWGRTGYALTRIFVTKTDSGGTNFNFSEWLGNGAGVALSNLYYTDDRTIGDNATKLLEACATDAISQVLKEFWPDIKRKWFQRASADH